MFLHLWNARKNLFQTTSHTRTVARQCWKDNKASETWNIVTPKPLNRSSPKVVHVIKSWIPTNKQNLMTIRQGVSFPVCAKLHVESVYSRGTRTTFHTNTSNDAVPRNDVPFRVRIVNLALKPHFPEKRYFGPVFDGTKFSAENRFTMRMLRVNSP